MSSQGYYVSEGDTETFVVRHAADFPPERLRKRISAAKEALGLSLEHLPRLPANLHHLARDCRELIGLTHLANPGATELVDYLTWMGRAIGADGARHAPGGNSIVVDLGTGLIEVPHRELLRNAATDTGVAGFTEGGRSYAVAYHDLGDEPPDLGDILEGYRAAIAARDQVALDLLAQAPLEALFAAKPSLEAKMISLPLARALRALFTRDESAARHLIDALAGCNAKEIDPRVSDYAIFIDSPSIELTLRLRVADAEATAQGTPTFDAALRQGLTYHRHYWRDFRPNGQAQQNDPRSFVSLPLLAWASLRFDLGFPVSIHSDYLPRNVVEHRAV